MDLQKTAGATRGLMSVRVSRSARAAVVAAALCAAFLCSTTVALGAAGKPSEQTIEGKLIFVAGTGPVLATSSKRIPLAGRYHYIFKTLEDKRLRNDEVRLKGRMRADGNFEVDNIYTIHHGELYRVRYYCETCNIVALGPGRCVCCQQPTELQEVPLNKHDHKILTTH